MLAPTTSPSCHRQKAFFRCQANPYVCSYTPKSQHQFSIFLKASPLMSINRHTMEALREPLTAKAKKPKH